MPAYPPPPASVDLTSSSTASRVFSDRTATTLRAASSVTSHSTKHSRRHHRSSRSHHGGRSSNNPYQNEFPHFESTGDVAITVACGGQEKRYLLHRLILSQCSGWFEMSTSERWSGQGDVVDDGLGSGHEPQSPGALQVQRLGTSSWQDEGYKTDLALKRTNSLQSAVAKRPFWQYELDLGNDSDDPPMLVRKQDRHSLFGGSSPQPQPPPARSKPPASSHGFFRSIAAMQSVVNAPSIMSHSSRASSSEPVDDTIRDYDNLFRIFYNYPPNIDSVSITEAYIQSKTLLSLADMYDALDVVGPRIDHHLLQFQHRLWKQIAKYPPSYLKLGYLARSKSIFGEAMTHVVGQWPAGQMQLRNIPRPVLDLIEDKADDLDELRARLEGQLFRLTLINNRGERPMPGHGPSSLDWLAISLFRHWLADNLPPPPAPIMAGFGTTANPNSTGQKSVTFSPHTTTNGRPDSSHAPIPVNESMLSASGAGSGGEDRPSATAGAITPAGKTSSSLVHLPRSSLVPATGRAYRLLGLAGQAYLPHDELKRHLKLHLNPQLYEKAQLRRFEKRVDDLKTQAQAIVRPLTRNSLQMNVGAAAVREGGSSTNTTSAAATAGGLGYLTCAAVGEGEWPW